jgi:hypothetical protein
VDQLHREAERILHPDRLAESEGGAGWNPANRAPPLGEPPLGTVEVVRCPDPIAEPFARGPDAERQSDAVVEPRRYSASSVATVRWKPT